MKPSITAVLKQQVRAAKGVELHGANLRLDFTYRGVRCRETLKGLPVTKANINHAVRKLATVNYEIAMGTFKYGDHFPGSKKAQKFGEGAARLFTAETMQFGHYLGLHLAAKQVDTRGSTFDGITRKTKRIKDAWEDRDMSTILMSELLVWRNDLLKELAPATINSLLAIVRGTFDHAVADGAIIVSPMNGVENHEVENDNKANPFSREEITLMEQAATDKPSERAAACFAMWSGLSISEWMGLSWDDVDLVKGTVTIRRSCVAGKYGATKTKTRERTIELLAPALYWLQDQKPRTYFLPAINIQVAKRTNKAWMEVAFRPVFRQTNGRPMEWSSSYRDNFFKGFLAALNISDRGPNQCRHTFASQMLSAFVSRDWIIAQMGHKDYAMLDKHYGKPIEQDKRSMATQVEAMLGLPASKPQHLALAS